MAQLSSATQPAEAKVVLLGASSVGKTSLLCSCQRQLGGRAAAAAAGPTVGAMFANLLLQAERTGEWARLQVWDTAGGERYRSLAPLYYRHAAAALLVFDIASWQSYCDLAHWVGELRRHAPPDPQQPPPLLFVVGNKIDIDASSHEVSEQLAGLYAQEVGAEFFSTSATRGDGVLPLFRRVAEAAALRLRQHHQHQHQHQHQQSVRLPDARASPQQHRLVRKACC